MWCCEMQLLGYSGWLLWYCFATVVARVLVQVKSLCDILLIKYESADLIKSLTLRMSCSKSAACLSKLITLPLIKCLKRINDLFIQFLFQVSFESLV